MSVTFDLYQKYNEHIGVARGRASEANTPEMPQNAFLTQKLYQISLFFPSDQNSAREAYGGHLADRSVQQEEWPIEDKFLAIPINEHGPT